MDTDRYEARRNGKDWRIVDTTTGESVRTFHSRKGLPASSLASRALNRCADMNAAYRRGARLIDGYMRMPS